MKNTQVPPARFDSSFVLGEWCWLRLFCETVRQQTEGTATCTGRCYVGGITSQFVPPDGGSPLPSGRVVECLSAVCRLLCAHGHTLPGRESTGVLWQRSNAVVGPYALVVVVVMCAPVGCRRRVRMGCSWNAVCVQCCG